MGKTISSNFGRFLRVSLIAILPATYFLKQGIQAQSILTNLTFWVFCLAYFIYLTQITIPPNTISLNFVDILLFIFAIYVFLSTIWSPYFYPGLRKEMEFIIFTLPIVYFVRFFIRDVTEIERVIKISIFIALILVVPYIVDFIFSGGRIERVTLKMVQPVAMGLFSSIHAYSSIYFFFKGNKKIFYLFCAILFSTSLFLTGSRGSIVALFLMTVWLLIKKRKSIRVYAGLLFILSSILFMLNKYIPVVGYIISRFLFTFSSYDSAGQTRLVLWQRGINSIVESPLFGKGAGSETWGYAHNIFLEIGSEHGLIGVFLLLVIICSLFKIVKKIKKEKVYELIMGIFWICAFVSLLDFSYSFNRYLFFSIGLILALYHLRRVDNAPSNKGFNNNPFT